MDPKSGMQTSKVDVLGDVVAQANFKLAQDGPQPGNPPPYIAGTCSVWQGRFLRWVGRVICTAGGI